ncbi:hypothetical protein [Magnetospirillum sulfuroxidans]|uniref:Uncharacterized protein n=1 Tax=Magnetospirillum sulfuroxidans TaxID=611300 RepID=A0ABS5IES1_9PROT|nr:hypothetical protein [Magnetospirillum sulfuroxidans]MBR9972687.1 hypothetical protein [Magnetospirillum sulfuroxidans]
MALGIDDILHYDPTDCPSCPIGKLKREWAAEEEGLLDVLLLNMDQINPSAEDLAKKLG